MIRILKESGCLKGLFLLFLLLAVFPSLQAQRKKLTLVQAKEMSYDKARQDVRVVTGSVIFEHDSAWLYCDSAVFNEQSNFVEAYENVRIRINDTVNLYGDELLYNGETRIADIQGKVKLVDGKTTLETPKLSFDRNTHISRYDHGGTIKDAENILTSQHAYYFLKLKRFFFKTKVKLINPRYTMTSDTLQYHTPSGKAEFFGPTTIVSKENIITCREGWYNTEMDLSSFSKGAAIENENRSIFSDSLYYDRTKGLGLAFGAVQMSDTSRNILINGEYVYYQELEGYAMVTDSAMARFYDGPDTLYIHGDTLEAFFDSTSSIQRVDAYFKVKFFRTDMQGMCDSLTYLAADSIIVLNREPVIWSEDQQLFADTIYLFLEEGSISKMRLIDQAMVISLEGINQYNQLKGKNIIGFFADNELIRMEIEGNAETVYYVREEDGSMVGVNRAIASDMIIRLESREIKEIVYIKEPSAVLYPMEMIPAGEDRLPGFQWLGHRRPSQARDIFHW